MNEKISILEVSFAKAIDTLKNFKNEKFINDLGSKIEAATSALDAISEFKKDIKEDINIDEFSENEIQPSDDEWGSNPDDFDDMIKACEDAEISINSIEEASSDPPIENEDQNSCSDNEENNLNTSNEDNLLVPSNNDDFDCDPPSDEHFRILKQFFGHASFRPMQWKIIHSVMLEQKDVCAVMATGYGKSLCYQYPGVFSDKPTVVISPLISLMEDQVMSLSVANIGACYLGSSQTQMGKVKEELLKGKYKVVYMTPEFAESAELLLKNLDSKVGRPNLFLEVCMKSGSVENDLLRVMTKKNGKPGFSGSTIIYCPTRNATEDVYNKLLDMKVSCQIYHAGMTPEQRKKAHREFVHDKVEVVVATVAFGMGIDKPDVRRVIHYGAPKDIESYYQEIGRAGRDGLPSICQVFYSNADFVTSKFFLKDIKSEKFLAHRADMISKMQQYLNSTRCRRQMLLSHFQGEEVKITQQSEKCCDNCKKKIKRSQMMKNNTSSQQSLDGKKDFAKEAKLLFGTIEATGGAFGLAVPILILRGSANQRITEPMKKCPQYGKGKNISEAWWKAFGRLLTCEKYLQETRMKSFGKQNMFGATVNITSKAKIWLEKAKRSPENSCPLILEMNTELVNLEEAKAAVAEKKVIAIPASVKRILPIPSSKPETESQTNEILDENVSLDLEDMKPNEEPLDPREEQLMNDLYKKVMSLRNSIADTEGLAPYMVFSNKNLLDIAMHRPVSIDALSQIEGIPSARISKFGESIIKLVGSFCKEHGLKDNVFTTAKPVPQTKKSDLPAMRNLKSTVQETYALSNNGTRDLNDIASERGLSVNTVVNHMIEAIRAGLHVELSSFGVTGDIFDTVSRVIQSPPINRDVSRLTPIKQLCPDYIEFNHIKAIIAVLESKYGVIEKPLEDDGNTKKTSPKLNSPDTQSGSPSTADTSVTKSPSIISSKRKESSYFSQSTEIPAVKKLKSNKLFKL
ncbi:Werner syndrome ATP-dependent helicase like protein [Argiope bruennichi]|uniref:ATP-dependent DNA helicase n=1 Tax=Argiope bruennichi TaxID=94029 RepID=A0A8T0F2P1_ARGBR|nr:Werner syndrome ATP-dependent helicase like protein [Argiope bruennichi]